MMTAAKRPGRPSRPDASKAYRARRIAAGDRVVHIWVTPHDQARWRELVAQYGDVETAFSGLLNGVKVAP